MNCLHTLLESAKKGKLYYASKPLSQNLHVAIKFGTKVRNIVYNIFLFFKKSAVSMKHCHLHKNDLHVRLNAILYTWVRKSRYMLVSYIYIGACIVVVVEE